MKLKTLACALGAALALALQVGAANAQATRTWVSGVGDDANPCSRTAPCKTFAGAISKTATDGEINCLDPGGYGAVTITKAITINCENTLGSVLVSGTNGIVVNTPAGSVVTLKGLEIEGLNTGLNGVQYIGAGILHVHKMQIRKFTQGAINFSPNGAAEFYISEAYLTDSGSGIVSLPSTSNGAAISIHNVRVENNTNGITIGRTAGGTTKATVTDSVVSGNSNNGITASVGSGAITLMLNRDIVTNNNGIGISNGNSTVKIGDSLVTGNGTGIGSVGGSFLSYKNNQINDNTSDGTPLTQAGFN